VEAGFEEGFGSVKRKTTSLHVKFIRAKFSVKTQIVQRVPFICIQS